MNVKIDIDNNTLIEECKNGDKEALNLFYIRFAPKMLSVIRRYVSDLNDAEDILHDGFIVAFTRLGSLRDCGRIEFWLATIMKNLSLQFLNNQDLSKVLHDIPEVEDTPSMEEIIDFDTLEHLIRKLPSGYQKVFRLAVLENKSHKEISKILGIAPNSSSSQLFHAKLMLRKLIREHQRQTGVFILLLIVIISGCFLLTRGLQDEGMSKVQFAQTITEESEAGETPDISPECRQTSVFNTAVSSSLTSQSQNIASVVKSTLKPANHSNIGIIINSMDSTAIDNKNVIAADSVIKPLMADNLTSETQNENSKTPEVLESVGISNDYVGTYTPDFRKPDNKNHQRVWSVGMSVDMGIVMTETQEDQSLFSPSLSAGNNFYWGPADSDDSSGSNNGNNKAGQSRRSSVATTRAQTNFDTYTFTPHHNDMPLSFSVALNRSIYKFLSIETGLSYTYLHSTFEIYREKSDCQWHYLGIPIKLKADILSSKRIRLYSSTGIQFDMPLYSKADVTSDQMFTYFNGGEFSSPVVWSWAVNVGVAWRLNNKIDIFIEPTMQYHFGPDHKVPNTWSDNPWGFSLPIGFRFNW